MGSLIAVDEMIASLVEGLDQRGELDNTVITFLSDNGMNWRSHRLGHKLVPYEEAIRVPFFMTGPGVPVGVRSEMVTNIDIGPTILDLAGAGVQHDLDGRSPVPVLAGNPAPDGGPTSSSSTGAPTGVSTPTSTRSLRSRPRSRGSGS